MSTVALALLTIAAVILFANWIGDKLRDEYEQTRDPDDKPE